MNIALKVLSPTPQEQIQNRLKACKSYDLEVFIMNDFF